MNSKKLTLVIYWSISMTLNAQSSFKLWANQAELNLLKIVDIQSSAATVTANAESYITINASSTVTPQSKSFIFGIGSREELTKTIELSISSGQIEVHQSVVIGSDYYCLGTSSSVDGYKLFIAKIDLKTSKLSNAYLLDNQINNITDVYMANADRNFYIAYTIQQGGNNFHKLIQVSETGAIAQGVQIVYEKPNMNELKGICLLSGNKPYLALRTYSNSSSINSQLQLVQFNEKLESQKTAKLNWQNQIGTNIDRFLFVGLKSNGSNIHLTCQALIGRDGIGSTAVTMIDDTLGLRTWRNYAAGLRVEDFKIGQTRFLLTGQQFVPNGNEGYTMVGINNANAIPEITNIFKDGFLNSSIATSSAIGTFGRGGIIMAARPNKSSEPYIGVAITQTATGRNCLETFTFDVTKDNMKLESIANYKIIPLVFAPNPELLNLNVSSINGYKETICGANAVVDLDDEKDLLNVQVIGNNEIIINSNENQQIKNSIQLFDINSKEIQLNIITKNNQVMIKMDNICSGIYFLKIGLGKVAKIIIP